MRYVGISEASAADIRAAHAVCPLSAVQLEWSLWSRDVEVRAVLLCDDNEAAAAVCVLMCVCVYAGRKRRPSRACARTL